MKFKIGSATDIGQKRTQNQDSIYPHAEERGEAEELGLFVVADGMGGHRGGETASAMVVEIVPAVVRLAQKNSDWNPRAVLSRAIETASDTIHERALSTPTLQGMGTTAVAMLFKDNTLTIGHVGDSRCYFLRPGAIWQATRDHSLVQEKLRAGLITRAEMKTDRMKNVITRSVGFEQRVQVEIYEMNVQKGDIFLLCSDGLSGLVDDSEMRTLVDQHLVKDNDIQKTVEQLIAAANAGGGDDNISTIIVEVAN